MEASIVLIDCNVNLVRTRIVERIDTTFEQLLVLKDDQDEWTAATANNYLQVRCLASKVHWGTGAMRYTKDYPRCPCKRDANIVCCKLQGDKRCAIIASKITISAPL